MKGGKTWACGPCPTVRTPPTRGGPKKSGARPAALGRGDLLEKENTRSRGRTKTRTERGRGKRRRRRRTPKRGSCGGRPPKPRAPAAGRSLGPVEGPLYARRRLELGEISSPITALTVFARAGSARTRTGRRRPARSGRDLPSRQAPLSAGGRTATAPSRSFGSSAPADGRPRRGPRSPRGGIFQQFGIFSCAAALPP